MPVNSTLAAQIALSSTTLFPNPASVSVTATETISGSAEFVTVVASVQRYLQVILFIFTLIPHQLIPLLL